MNHTNSTYDAYIRPLKVRFWFASALFMVVAVVCVSLARTRQRQERTYADLVRAGEGFDKLKKANANRVQALTTLKAQRGNATEKKSPERLIYGKIDEIRERLRPDDVIVAAIEKKGGEVSLAYTLKFKNQDYSTFLNAISYLQESALPVTTINDITISKGEDSGKSVVLFTITGKVLTSEKSKP